MTHARAKHKTSALIRLDRLVQLSASDHALLETSTASQTAIAARSEIIAEGESVRRPLLLLSGWACRVRNLRDGHRQILELILPGELIGRWQSPPEALSSVASLTQLRVCPAPEAAPMSTLAKAYEASAVRSEAGLLRQITRLGRFSALQRTADLLLELHERLLLSSSAEPTSFHLPLTQETLADVLGLTAVHVNRTLKDMRHQGLISISSGMVRFTDVPRLREMVDGRTSASDKTW